jgi:hypothetical protein
MISNPPERNPYPACGAPDLLSSVIPAKAGIHAWYERWTCALTARFAVAIIPDSV